MTARFRVRFSVLMPLTLALTLPAIDWNAELPVSACRLL